MSITRRLQLQNVTFVQLYGAVILSMCNDVLSPADMSSFEKSCNTGSAIKCTCIKLAHMYNNSKSRSVPSLHMFIIMNDCQGVGGSFNDDDDGASSSSAESLHEDEEVSLSAQHCKYAEHFLAHVAV